MIIVTVKRMRKRMRGRERPEGMEEERKEGMEKGRKERRERERAPTPVECLVTVFLCQGQP